MSLQQGTLSTINSKFSLLLSPQKPLKCQLSPGSAAQAAVTLAYNLAIACLVHFMPTSASPSHLAKLLHGSPLPQPGAGPLQMTLSFSPVSCCRFLQSSPSGSPVRVPAALQAVPYWPVFTGAAPPPPVSSPTAVPMVLHISGLIRNAVLNSLSSVLARTA